MLDSIDTGSNKSAQAEKLVEGYMGWSAGAGLIPVPGLDLVGIGAVQLKMLDDLSKLYGIPFSKNAAKSIIGALCGSGGATAVAFPVASLMKVVPVIGPLAAMLTEPAAAAAATYALGKVFVLHFESGGTFLDFDPDRVRKFYDEHFAAARSGSKTSSAPAPKTS